jgi:hypothetical protein
MLCWIGPVRLEAQSTNHDPAHHAEQDPKSAMPSPQSDPNHHVHEHNGGNAGSPVLPMAALGSGTGLLPAVGPAYGWHLPGRSWLWMVHGELKAGYNQQGGPRGVGKAESQNWLMVMGERRAGPGGLMLRGMFTAEPLTTPRPGFPQLLQTGETYRGRPLVDAQHPHDLFMELAASYAVPLGEGASFHLYGGPVAEPALGPVAFMHRPSASENPAVPLGHHHQDSTHITHGVITAGLTSHRFRLEGSLFHGAEPDENRADMDLGKLDSWSARIWFTPTRNWTMQYSHAHLVDPEFLFPGNQVRRTASVSYHRAWMDGFSATTLVWGRNRELHGSSDALLLESTANFLDVNYVYTRIEVVEKFHLVEDTFIVPDIPPFPGFKFGAPIRAALPGLERRNHAAAFHTGAPDRVLAVTFGSVRDVLARPKMRLGLGADVTLYKLPLSLQGLYGTNLASFRVFIRIRPGKMQHG